MWGGGGFHFALASPLCSSLSNEHPASIVFSSNLVSTVEPGGSFKKATPILFLCGIHKIFQQPVRLRSNSLSWLPPHSVFHHSSPCYLSIRHTKLLVPQIRYSAPCSPSHRAFVLLFPMPRIFPIPFLIAHITHPSALSSVVNFLLE